MQRVVEAPIKIAEWLPSRFDAGFLARFIRRVKHRVDRLLAPFEPLDYNRASNSQPPCLEGLS